jgi:hypothetical protein
VEKRLRKFCRPKSDIAEVKRFSKASCGLEMAVQLIVDDGNAGRTTRKLILSKKIKHMGISHNPNHAKGDLVGIYFLEDFD